MWMGLGEELSEDCIREGALKMGLLPPEDPLCKWTVDTALMRLVASHREIRFSSWEGLQR